MPSLTRLTFEPSPKSQANQEHLQLIDDDECNLIENMFGAAFVTCQAEITSVVSNVGSGLIQAAPEQFPVLIDLGFRKTSLVPIQRLRLDRFNCTGACFVHQDAIRLITWTVPGFWLGRR
jgi:hypothetical protein